MNLSTYRRVKRRLSAHRLLYAVVIASSLAHGATFDGMLFTRAGATGQNLTLPEDWNGKIPLVITNRCDSTVWPGIATQYGTGPALGGFTLEMGKSKDLWVSPNWQGRVWGRTNCTVNGDSAQCETGDCFGKLDCKYSGSTPATLVEFNLEGGTDNTQTFYDLSIVDGYNLPMGVNYLPGKNTTFIPPNLTNCACIATSGWLAHRAAVGYYYSNATYPVPLEEEETNQSVRDWCPWPYLAFPPKRPGDGVYPYPVDNIERPDFSPCNSACTATGLDKDCCVGKYNSPKICKPSGYSLVAKAVCPDAYSYAYADKTSTFAIPKGGGFEVIICPKGRSTNIIQQLGAELDQLNTYGRLSRSTLSKLMNATYVEADRSAARQERPVLVTTIVASAVTALWMAL